MRLKRIFFLLSILTLVSCSQTSKNIENAIDEQAVNDRISILHTFNAEDAIIALFERTTHADIGIAVIDKSKDKSKTSISGYLIQNVEKAPK